MVPNSRNISLVRGRGGSGRRGAVGGRGGNGREGAEEGEGEDMRVKWAHNQKFSIRRIEIRSFNKETSGIIMYFK